MRADAKPPLPEVSVVVATHNRAERLSALIEALRAQTLGHERFEVIVVDDGSIDETPRLLANAATGDGLGLRPIRRATSAGPATARQEGWQHATAELIAFTDDDCVPQPDWLEQGLQAVARNPGAIVQGSTAPAPFELHHSGPFSRTITIDSLDPAFQTCNILYPRDVLERVGGFDTEGFGRAPGGEDSDLAWRAIKSGASAVFAPDARVHHAVEHIGPVGRLRVASRWTTPMLAYVRHPELRRAHFVKGIFWKGSHYLLVRAALSLVLPRRLRWLRPWLAGPYLLVLRDRLRDDGAGPLLVPYLVAHDLVEIWAVGRAAIRYRSPMI